MAISRCRTKPNATRKAGRLRRTGHYVKGVKKEGKYWVVTYLERK